MSARPYAITLLFAAAASAVVSWNSLSSMAVAMCAVCLVGGFVWRRIWPTLLSGLLLYPALAVALNTILPTTLGYLASALFVIVVCERLTFEYDVTAVLGSLTGIDAEARTLVSEISRKHAKRLLIFAAFATVVIAGSAVAASITVYASELIAAGLLLFIVVFVYATR